MRSDFQEINKKYWFGFRYAFHGLMFVIRNEKNFQIQLVMTFIALLFGFLLHLSGIEWILLWMTIGLVLALEVTNTAIEQIMNYLAPEIHPIVGRIKDISAAAVLIASVIAVINGCILFLPKIIVMLW